MLRTWAAGIAGVVIMVSGPALADDVTDAVNEGLQAYEAGRLSDAAASFDYAAQIVRQHKADRLGALLPKPLPGWSADSEEPTSTHTAMFGGGISVERSYSRAATDDSGEDAASTVNFTGDSAMMQGMLAVLSNPALATADGGKLERIGGERALVKYRGEDRAGEITVAVASRYLVNITGYNLSLEELRGYATGIDYKALAALP